MERALKEIAELPESTDFMKKRVEEMTILSVAADTCKCAQQVLGNVYDKRAELIEENRDEWCEFDILVAKGAVIKNHGGKRARRMSSHIKEAVVKNAMIEGPGDRASLVAKCMKISTASSTQRWQEDACANIQAATRMSFRKTGTLSID